MPIDQLQSLRRDVRKERGTAIDENDPQFAALNEIRAMGRGVRANVRHSAEGVLAGMGHLRVSSSGDANRGPHPHEHPTVGASAFPPPLPPATSNRSQTGQPALARQEAQIRARQARSLMEGPGSEPSAGARSIPPSSRPLSFPLSYKFDETFSFRK